MNTHFRFLALFLVVTMACAMSGQAQANPKPWIWGWWPSHWRNLDFKPYLEDPKQPHNSQWNGANWHPQDWVDQRDSDENKLIRGFYYADILRDQYEDDGVPVLEVGPAFYMLGGQDRRRVAETVDYVYKVTEQRVDGMFMLYDWRTKKAIGSYTRYGLQLQ